MTRTPSLPPTPLRPIQGELVERHLMAAGVPDRFADRRLDTFKRRPGTQRAVAAAREVSDTRQQRGLVLTGPPGTGKTHLAVGILAARVEAWLEAYPHDVVSQGPEGIATRPPLLSRFAVVPELMDRLRERFNVADVPDPLPALGKAPLLILDDLGAEKPTEYVVERLYVLVNHRYNAKRPTVVTSNYSLAELAERGYDRMVSRLLEDAEHVALEASDYRLAPTTVGGTE